MYEIIFTAASRKEDGKGYDLENLTTFTKRLGNVEDDVSLEDVVALILKQRARRDKLVTDVEIYEFTKKKISFKETDNGIILKNRKFALDATGVLDSTGLVEPQHYEQESLPSQAIDQKQQLNQALRGHVHQPGGAPIGGIRYEVFEGDPNYVNVLTRKGFKMTIGKRYAIIKEKSVLTRVNSEVGGSAEMPGYEYTVQDDLGATVKIPSMYFIPEQRPLVGQQLLDLAAQERNGQPKLLYQGGGDNGMPVLRNSY